MVFGHFLKDSGHSFIVTATTLFEFLISNWLQAACSETDQRLSICLTYVNLRSGWTVAEKTACFWRANRGLSLWLEWLCRSPAVYIWRAPGWQSPTQCRPSTDTDYQTTLHQQ